MLVARIDELEGQVRELSQTDFGAQVEETVASLEQQVKSLAERMPGDQVTQAITRLEDQVEQLSGRDVGEEIRQQIARLEEQIAALGDGSGAQRTREAGQGSQPAAVVILPAQDAQTKGQQGAQQTGGQQQGGQQTQQTGEQQTGGQQTGGQQTGGQQQGGQQQGGQQQPRPAEQTGNAAQQGAQQQGDQDEVVIQGRTVVPTAPSAAPSDESPCAEQLAQLEEDLQRAEQLGMAVGDAASEFDEAQAMLSNNSESLCRAAVKRAQEELIAVGFEPTELN
jgi:Ca-activated chloride channel family protein